MKVVLVNGNPHWGGGERWFTDAACALTERGHSVVLAGRREGELLKRFPPDTAVTVPLDDAGTRWETLAPDIVLCNTGSDLRFVVKTAGPSPTFPITLRRGIARPLTDNWFRRRYWKALSAVLVNSDFTRSVVRQSLPWFPEDRIRRIYNPATFQPAPRRPAADGPIRLGAIGRLVRSKGIDVLLRALAALDSGIDWSLEIAGDGSRRSSLERLARKLGLAHRCRFLGEIRDVASFYANRDIIVIPSLYEGFCYVAQEAALAGLPVVATQAGSLPELVEDHATGLLVPPSDPAALAAAIRELATDHALAQRLGQRATETARANFNPDGISQQLCEFLEWAKVLPAVGQA